MLPSIKAALRVKARRNAAIASELDRNAETVTKWFSGKYYIPQRVRFALDTAIGCPVDWEAYEADYAADNDRRFALKAEAAAPAPEPVAPPPAPKAVSLAPAPLKIAATAPRRLVASAPIQKPPARPQATPTAPAAKQGFLSRFLASDPGDMFA